MTALKPLTLDAAQRERVVSGLKQAALFSSLEDRVIEQVLEHAAVCSVEAGQTIVSESEPSDSFYVLLKGHARVLIKAAGGELIEVGQLVPPLGFGETGLLLGKPRTATVIITKPGLVLRVDGRAFEALVHKVPGFCVALARMLAARLDDLSHKMPVPRAEDPKRPTQELLALFPIAFMMRHRVVPLSRDGSSLVVGTVDEPTTVVVSAIQNLTPGTHLELRSISTAFFDVLLQSTAGVGAQEDTEGTVFSLEELLTRVVAEGASDLHLSAGHAPRWRIDGEIRTIEDAAPLQAETALSLLRPIMESEQQQRFLADNDVDFAYSMADGARFRVNMFRDHQGVSAVLRQISARIHTAEDLGLPKAVLSFCQLLKGLVVVTGPTGSGKSTTLAAMVDFINRSRGCHILTLEDPIEFVHQSKKALVNQREIGRHTKSFGRALKAALREDPDIVLVGEMRDLETVSLAMETANTGHLVFGTLHTATAVGTIDRIIEMFPAEEQNRVRVALSESLRGVVAQTLCKKIGGGRTAALEILSVNSAVSHLIREGKTIQIINAMQSGRAQGNCVLNDELLRLVQNGLVTPEEALRNSADKPDLAKRIEGVPVRRDT